MSGCAWHKKRGSLGHQLSNLSPAPLKGTMLRWFRTLEQCNMCLAFSGPFIGMMVLALFRGMRGMSCVPSDLLRSSCDLTYNSACIFPESKRIQMPFV